MAEISQASYDLIVIGGGPAGYVGAIRAAQLGLKAACVERDALGGICNNWGCIPTKALLANAEFYHRLKHEAADWGVLAENVGHDWSKVIGRSRDIAGLGAKGIGGLFKKHKIDHVEGAARITRAAFGSGRGEVEVADAQGKISHKLAAKRILVCTGARPRALPFAPFDGDRIISSKEAMSLQTQPESLIIIGAGAIGMEFAYFYNAFGTKVTVVEMLDRLLPNEDHEVSKEIEKRFRRQGVNYHVSRKTESIETTDQGVKVTIEPVDGGSNGEGDKNGEGSETLEAERVLVAIGVQGNVEGVFDESLGVKIERGHFLADRTNYTTNVPGVHAVGDVIGAPWLAHVASEEAVIAVEHMAGHTPEPLDYDAVPACTYCVPQVASLGRTERALQDQGLKSGEDYTVGKFPFLASGKARAVGNTDGFVKIIADKKFGEILGVHMIGENVTELLAEMGLAKRLEATAEEVIATMHAHPTLSEAVHEAALGTEGRMLHY